MIITRNSIIAQVLLGTLVTVELFSGDQFAGTVKLNKNNELAISSNDLPLRTFKYLSIKFVSVP